MVHLWGGELQYDVLPLYLKFPSIHQTLNIYRDTLRHSSPWTRRKVGCLTIQAKRDGRELFHWYFLKTLFAPRLLKYWIRQRWFFGPKKLEKKTCNSVDWTNGTDMMIYHDVSWCIMIYDDTSWGLIMWNDIWFDGMGLSCVNILVRNT